ncbi:MAG TPA: PSD1 and planctomycete cytochrome C domain-containing protein [Bryobacteraceae bacterium]|nr:PSD1 and planctomycete cytochrome C domain-containing protein [Bryobacteraceae bacterium]
MSIMLLKLCSLALLAFTLLADQRKVDYVKDVQPLLQARCYGCHGPGQQMSGLRLDLKDAATRGGYSGPLFQAGNGAGSTLIHRVSGDKGFSPMPPAGPRLTADEIGLLRVWIDQGASWPAADSAVAVARKSSHWAFQPIPQPLPPRPSNSAWVRNPIDAFILARLEREAIAPSPQAAKHTLLRRASLDLTGLPPTPAEVDSFIADKRPDAYERQVDRLLASPHFAEKWARHWLDLARYADSDGYEKDWVRPWAWRYRQWVIEAIDRDMPFDQFTVEQIAGDLLPQATADQKIATGFHRNTLTNREGGIDNAQFRFENTVDRASTVGSVWLGLTVGCAQCHDHKFDPISQKDFYQTFAFFDNVEEVDIDAPLPGELGPWLREKAEYQKKRTQLLAEYHVPELQAEWEKRLHETIASPGKWLDWDLAWDCVQKLTESGDGAGILQKPAQQRTPREQDVLTDHFVRNYHFAVGAKRYAEVKFKELDEKLSALKTDYPRLSQAMVVAERPPHPTYLRVRGDYKNPGIEVMPAGLSVLPQIAKTARPTRLDLAHWLVSPENPLTARVAVNRIWQELFGRGIVASSDDFGTRGNKPSHPELLDWLARRFMDSGWSRKQMIRTIVTSATYRQSSKARPELDAVDPSNTLLARQARLRLPAELIRDSALAVSGLLSLQVGGKSVRPPQPAGVMEMGYGKKGGAQWAESKGADRYRRGLYIEFLRSTPYPQLVNFDAPKSNVPLCRRDRSNTSLQALNLLNDPVFVEAAQALAYRVTTESSDPLNHAFRLALSREPSEREAQRMQEYLKKYDWMGVSSILLNLDEFITRE